MASLIPSLGSVLGKMTPGERRFGRRLESHLEDDYLCWYDVPVGPNRVHPDFVVLHPRRGLLVLEVKDWKLDSIQSIDKASVALLTPKGLKRVINPLEQARQNVFSVIRLFEGDPVLTVAEREHNQGRLLFPWGYGLVLANISREAFQSTDLGQVLQPSMVICQDEITESVDMESFQKRLWGMFTVNFKCTLTLPEVDRVRWHLFPDIRVNAGQGKLFAEFHATNGVIVAIPDMIRVMDLQQEQLARSLGEGHRVIHGVAGSGKTMILGYRAKHLAQVLQKPILILCFNVALSARLDQMVTEGNLREKVSVRNFHRWCSDQLKLYHVAKPTQSGPEFFEQLVLAVIRAIDIGQIPRAQYGAVLIDEGHDFHAEWLKLVTQMIDPETNSLLLLYDDAQSIYDATTTRDFSFSSVGIQAKGRTTILRLNYRNTAEVLSLAYEFAKDFMTPAEAEEDGVPLIQPKSAGRHGPIPVLNQLPNLQKEGEFIAKKLMAINKAGWSWRDMAVVYRSRFIGEQMNKQLRAEGIPVEWLGEANGRHTFNPSDDSVKVMTMHASKGLEFPVVAIPGLGYMPYGKLDLQEEARLLYVAMTRAMDMLLMTCHQDTDFVRRIRQARTRVAA